MLLVRKSLFMKVPFRADLRRHQEADWILRAAQVPGFRLLVVDRVLGTWRTDAPQARVSTTGGWEYSLAWIQGNRSLVSRRAYAAFVLTAVAALAASEGAWRAFWALLREARTHGSPAAIHYAVFAGMWLVPRRIRASLRFAFFGRSDRSVRVLVLGQTPPPFHGQAIAIEQMLSASYDCVRLIHVRLHFSRELGEVGRASVRKSVHLVAVLARAVAVRISSHADVLYYVPAGPDRVPMWRDFLLLVPLRPLFRRTVFHFHATGLATAYHRLTWPERALFRAAYFDPESAIILAPQLDDDARFVRARNRFVLPNGIPDGKCPGHGRQSRPAASARVLWVSNLIKSKGILVLLAACALLQRRGVSFDVDIVGDTPERETHQEARMLVQQEGLVDRVHFVGPLTGDLKWQRFAAADLFCLPTFYEREGMPLVILEAMQCGLPVVATNWRGVPSMVRDRVNGLLVPTGDSEATADALERLIREPELRKTYGAAGRQMFEEDFTLDQFSQRLEKILLSR